MKALAVLCNVVLLAFTCLVLVAEGVSSEAAYIVLTLLLIVVPGLSVVALVRGGGGGTWSFARVAALCNIVLLGFICWAIVDQYPHPEEPGFLPYLALVVLTPVLSAVALAYGGRRTAGEASG